MPKKVCALDPRVREEECTHPAGFAYTGRVPGTGSEKCYLCGTRKEDAHGTKDQATQAQAPS